MTARCWRSECRNGCYYPDACSERPTVESGSVRALRYAQAQALTERARGRTDEERAWLDMCALLETGPDECVHGSPEGDCPSCAACAACRGECGVCPYVSANSEVRP